MASHGHIVEIGFHPSSWVFLTKCRTTNVIYIDTSSQKKLVELLTRGLRETDAVGRGLENLLFSAFDQLLPPPPYTIHHNISIILNTPRYTGRGHFKCDWLEAMVEKSTKKVEIDFVKLLPFSSVLEPHKWERSRRRRTTQARLIGERETGGGGGGGAENETLSVLHRLLYWETTALWCRSTFNCTCS